MTKQEFEKKQKQYFSEMLTEEEQNLLHYIPTVSELLEFAAREYAILPAISDGKLYYNYRELYERVAKRRGYLKKLGFEAGDRIAVLSPNTMDAMELYLAIVTSGCVSVMLPVMPDSKTVAALCGKFKVKALFYDNALGEAAKDVSVNKYTAEFTDCVPAEAAEITKDTVCSICLTGGTTGVPKGAVLTHGAMMRGAFNGCYIPGGVLYQRYIAILPFSHIFGLVKSFLSCIYTGGLIFECRDIKRAIGMIPVLKPTTLVLVPGMAEIIVQLTRLKGKDFSASLKTIVTGAAPVPPKLMREIDSMGIQVLAGYGMTEGANLTSGNKYPMDYPDSMGMIYPEQECKIVDGELRIKGDNLMLGYFGDEESTKDAFDEDGFLKTGDLARFDENGYIYIVGRIKNLIILANGEKVSPEELEELFYKNKYVKDCLVKEDTLNGKSVIAIEILPDAVLTADMDDNSKNDMFRDIVRDINMALPTYKHISKITVRTEDFKRTNAMKISRK